MTERVNSIACLCRCLVMELGMTSASNARSDMSVVAVPLIDMGIINSMVEVPWVIIDYAKMV